MKKNIFRRIARWLKNNLLWREGKGIILALVCSALLFYLVFPSLVIVPVVFFLFCLYFFRNPVRSFDRKLCTRDILLSPTDGEVLYVEDIKKNGRYARKVAIFLSPFDVHVNRIPMNGVVEKIDYKPGAFGYAKRPKSSLDNEHNDVTIMTDCGPVLIRQISGMLARRICCWVHLGQRVVMAEEYGMIKFGSRVEIFVPAAVQLFVTPGQRVWAGKTMVGKWRSVYE
jgi:phosphatidylserine decarboxylase